MAERYSQWCAVTHGHEMSPCPTGAWVRHEEYDRLAAELADYRARHETSVSELKRLLEERGRLAAEVAALREEAVQMRGRMASAGAEIMCLEEGANALRERLAAASQYETWYTELLAVIYEGADGINERPDPRIVVQNLLALYVEAGDKLAAAEAEVEELRAWQESALAVEREWDAQAVAKLLGAKPGESCRRVIMQKLPELVGANFALRAEVEAMRPVVEAAMALVEKYDATCSALDMTISMSRSNPEIVQRAREEQGIAMVRLVAIAKRLAAVREGKC